MSSPKQPRSKESSTNIDKGHGHEGPSKEYVFGNYQSKNWIIQLFLVTLINVSATFLCIDYQISSSARPLSFHRSLNVHVSDDQTLPGLYNHHRSSFQAGPYVIHKLRQISHAICQYLCLYVRTVIFKQFLFGRYRDYQTTFRKSLLSFGLYACVYRCPSITEQRGENVLFMVVIFFPFLPFIQLRTGNEKNWATELNKR